MHEIIPAWVENEKSEVIILFRLYAQFINNCLGKNSVLKYEILRLE